MDKGKKPLKLSIREIGLPKLLIMLGAGIILIFLSLPDVLPDGKLQEKQSGMETETEISPEGDAEYVERLEKKLENVLERVKDVGKVKVMITLSASKEKVPLKDIPYNIEEFSEADGEGGTRDQYKESKEEQSVLVEGTNGAVPYVLKEKEPVIEGVVIVAKGGDDVRVQTEIIGAVEVLFGVAKHKIKVMKMDYE